MDQPDDQFQQAPVEQPLSGPIGAPHVASRSRASKTKQGTGAGVVGLLIAAKVGLLKLLLTFGSLIVSVVLYASSYGLPFALGLVGLLFFHEAGHWVAYRRIGITPNAMIFIPFVGAAVIARRHPGMSTFDEVTISLAGPVIGGLAAAGCLILAFLFPFNGPFYVSLAATGFLLNAINLLPIGPLDGGHVLRAIMQAGHTAQSGWKNQRPLCSSLFAVTAILLVGGFFGVRGTLGDALAEGAALYHVYTPLSASASPDGIAVSRTGIVWFTEEHTGFIGRLDPASGSVHEYHPATPHSRPLRITAGPDGAMWFTEASGDAIGRVTDAGQITEFHLPTASAYPWDIAGGPDGALYFVEHDAAKIGRITTSGAITEYPLASGRNPSGMSVGPDGALWFVEDDGATRGIGRMTTSGLVSEYTLPLHDSGPKMITTGADGQLYATLVKANAIARISPTASGIRTTIFTFPNPPAAPAGQPDSTSNNPYSIVAGMGGIWSTQLGENALARLTPDGTVTEYLAFAGDSMQHTFPANITTAADGSLWFTASDSNDQNERIVHLTGVPSPVGNGS